MDCDEKNGLLIFLLVFTGVLAALVTAFTFIFCRKRVRKDSLNINLHGDHIVVTMFFPSVVAEKLRRQPGLRKVRRVRLEPSKEMSY